MTLPGLLTEAARLMPERLKWVGTRSAQVNYRGETRMFAHTGTHAELVWLEAACQEELEARGWDWHTHNTGPEGYRRHCAQVYPSQSALSGMFQAYAATPAEALLSALIQAVEGEGV